MERLLPELEKQSIPNEAPFPSEEYARRLSRVRESMRALGMDVLLLSNTPNKSYVLGYETCMPPAYSVAIIPLKGELAMHLLEIEAPLALLHGFKGSFEVLDWTDPRSAAEQLGETLKRLGYEGKTIGIEMGLPETFASGAYDAKSFATLKRMLPTAHFVDATTLVTDIRLIKTPAEVEYMRKAGQMTFLGLQASLDTMSEGKTDNEVVAAAYKAMIEAGSEVPSIDPMCLVGYRSGYGPHCTYKRTRLKKGDTVYMEYTATYQRYNAPSMRSAVIGTPSRDVSKVAAASLATVQLLLENIRPGRTCHDVALAAKVGLAGIEDVAYWHRGYGYSIGMGFQPTWTEAPAYIQEGEDRELVPGMTFHLPIFLVAPGRFGIGFSESIVVTDSGCATITPGKNRELRIIAA